MLSTNEQQYVRSYQYHGGDLSPVYKHFLSPFAQYCVDHFTPCWMAPNVLTLLGLIFSFASAIATFLVNPSLQPGAPRWLHFFTGLCVFSYQTLDNMDGKQARRTGSSSALGMFFDHGCDAINAGVTILSMASVFGTGWTGKIFMCYASSFSPFYLQTGE